MIFFGSIREHGFLSSNSYPHLFLQFQFISQREKGIELLGSLAHEMLFPHLAFDGVLFVNAVFYPGVIPHAIYLAALAAVEQEEEVGMEERRPPAVGNSITEHELVSPLVQRVFVAYGVGRFKSRTQ